MIWCFTIVLTQFFTATAFSDIMLFVMRWRQMQIQEEQFNKQDSRQSKIKDKLGIRKQHNSDDMQTGQTKKQDQKAR